MERLSSGLRINSAKDDATGLAISNRMTSQIRGLNQAVRNANDGISLAQTAEGAMQEGVSILQRIRELAVQSANATNSAADRASLQAEVNQLVSEFYGIRNTTEFNGIEMLDGSFTAKQFQIGANAGEAISVTIDSMEIGRYLTTDYQLESKNTNAGSGTVSSSGALLDILPPNHQNTIGSQEITINGYLGTDTVSISQGDSAADIVINVNNATSSTGVSAVAQTNVTFSNFSDDGIVFIGLGSGGNHQTIYASILTTDLSNLADEINAVSDVIGVTAIASGGSIELTQAEGEDIEVYAYAYDHNWTSTFDIITESETITLEDDNDPGTQQPDATIISGSVTFQSNDTFSVSSNVDPVSGGSIFGSAAGVGETSIYTGPSDALFKKRSVDISTQAGANEAILIVDDSLKRIDSQRGELGAIQNRFESTISNLQNISENLSTARSRIVDADIAFETSNLTKQNILQQAGVSILSQANLQPQLVLSLLEDI